jgi:hypothetical protein
MQSEWTIVDKFERSKPGAKDFDPSENVYVVEKAVGQRLVRVKIDGREAFSAGGRLVVDANEISVRDSGGAK